MVEAFQNISHQLHRTRNECCGYHVWTCLWNEVPVRFFYVMEAIAARDLTIVVFQLLEI